MEHTKLPFRSVGDKIWSDDGIVAEIFDPADPFILTKTFEANI